MRGPAGAGRRLALLGYALLFQSMGMVMYTIYLGQAPFSGMFQGYTFAWFILALLYLLIFRRAEGEAFLGMIVGPLVCLFSLVGIFTPLERVHDPVAGTPDPLVRAACLGGAGRATALFGIAFATAVLYLCCTGKSSPSAWAGFSKAALAGGAGPPDLAGGDYRLHRPDSGDRVRDGLDQVRAGRLLQFDAKEIITLADWVLFAFYLHSRFHRRLARANARPGWRLPGFRWWCSIS